MADFWSHLIVPFFVAQNNHDLDGALFRIGQVVQATITRQETSQVITGEVLGIACHSKDEYEYAIEGYPFLLWEEELTAIES